MSDATRHGPASAGSLQGQFRPGQSGNPRGRARGSRNRATVLLEKLMAGEAEAVTRAVIEKAKAGDLMAARIVLDRILPARKDRSVTFNLPVIVTAADATTASAAILKAVADGDLAPGEAAEIMALIEGHLKTIEAVEVDARLSALEKGRRP